ncbi:MAG: hypothetical protein P8130_07510 [Deltaproteobacteria bacterium]
MRKMLCFMVLFLLGGCSSWNVAYAPVPTNSTDQDTAEVVVIRDMTCFAGQAGKMDDNWLVAVDGHSYVGLRAGQYTMFAVSTDKAHEVGVKRHDVWWHDTKIPVILEPGNRYFYLAGVADLYSAGIKQITEEEGKAWMAKNRYIQVANPK